MLRSLDRYTEYYPEERQKDLKTMLTGKYAGIGALIRYHQKLKQVVIDEPYEGMPAAEAGLKKGDIILQIDDTVMTDKNTSYVSSHLRGEPGTTFMLKIQRPSTGKKMNFKMTRRAIKMPEITWYGMLNEGKDKIGYINLNTFTGEPAKPMRLAFLDLKKQGAEKLILDLRNNGGGNVNAAEFLASHFTEKEVTVGYTCYKTGPGHNDFSKLYRNSLSPADEDIRWIKPVVLLVNRGCFSSANDFACIMKALDNVTLAGDTTGGGGGLPMSSELPNGWIVRFSSSPSFDADGNPVEFGIAPDIILDDMKEEDINRGVDSYIESARKLINDRIINP